MKVEKINPQSTSEVIRATHIIVVRLEEVELSEWETAPNQVGVERTITADLIIEQILKGEVEQDLDTPIPFTVSQRGPGQMVLMTYLGLWAHVDVVPGVRFLAFCSGETTDVTVLLKEPYCERLVNPDDNLADAELAVELEAQIEDLSASDILNKAFEVNAAHKDIFARYVWERIRHEVFQSEKLFDELMDLVEASDTNLLARGCYLSAVDESLSVIPETLTTLEHRLIRAMFRLLLLPEASGLHENIRQVYLPNNIGLSDSDSDSIYSKNEIFAGYKELQDKAVSYFNQHADEEDEEDMMLVAWLAS